MKIAIAADHAGYEEKEQLKPLLDELGIQYEDLGTASPESVDYPNYARKVADEVASGRVDQGLLVCGSGTGMAIVANKVPGVRAAVAWTPEVAALAREHNDANVLSLGARVTPAEELPKIVRAWFNAKFEGGRHERRVEQIREIVSAERARRTTTENCAARDYTPYRSGRVACPRWRAISAQKSGGKTPFLTYEEDGALQYGGPE